MFTDSYAFKQKWDQLVLSLLEVGFHIYLDLMEPGGDLLVFISSVDSLSQLKYGFHNL